MIPEDEESTASFESNSTSGDATDTDWNEVAPWLRLSMVPGVGPLMRKELLERFGSARGVLEASPAELRDVPRLGPKLCRAITTAHELDVEAEIERCRQNNIRLLTQWQPQYPEALNEIPDPPAVLYMQGELLPQDSIAIAVVGTRHATQYGRQQAQRLASSLARAGVTIVSGLARGIDTEAHRAALDAGGRTVAVLGSGLMNVYPAENKQLAREITNGSGAVLSENATQAKPLRGAFPRRNRIVTGLCQGVIVVEAGDRSGALISARLSMEQGRDVFAVPGRVDSRTSRGCHRLIRDGAKLVESADDVLEELGPMFQSATDSEGHEVHHPAELQLNDQERAVLNAISNGPTPIDEVVASSGLPVHRVLSTISVLEMRRMVRRLSGTQIARV